MMGKKDVSHRPEVREKLRSTKLREIKNGTYNYGFKKGKGNINYIDGRSKFLPPARYGDD